MSMVDLVDDIYEMLNTAEAHSIGAEPPSIGAEPPSTFACCIYKVPSHIRTLNENAYTPKFVSIGPFHHGHPQHQNMERHKLIYFKAFLERTKACLNTLVDYIDSIISAFRGCYSETLQFSQDGLVKLILIDSGFIIQLFWRKHQDQLITPWLGVGILYDLLLLENQLPFFVIEEIYKLSLSSTNASVPNTMIPSFRELTFYYFDSYNKSKFYPGEVNIGIMHFTDLIRIFQLLPYEILPDRVYIDIGENHIPSATELLEAGVRFKVNTERGILHGFRFKVNTRWKSLLSCRFSRRVLEIPKLSVDNWTETLFRNMVALEHCHYPDDSYITDYVAVMDYLINTGKDVDILVQNEILENWLGDSDSVANSFNGLCKNVNRINISSNFSDSCRQINTICNDPSNKLKASLKSSLKRDYCNTPWKAAASVAGIILLVLTVIQTVCSVLQVVQQK